MVRFYIPKSSEACPCSCHRFGGRLPMPRDQAVMPYWVPQILRPHRKAVKRQQSCKGIQDENADPERWNESRSSTAGLPCPTRAPSAVHAHLFALRLPCGSSRRVGPSLCSSLMDPDRLAQCLPWDRNSVNTFGGRTIVGLSTPKTWALGWNIGSNSGSPEKLC
ncbi:uncharacterized protein C16orf95 homolog isoform X4 [Meles meles]|nr:uncharacterized protein C16orf95 homolog isoform X4 [Meles meles]XP_045843480.1 uncharacterized protein C16orf95 homolog isoform X4 [Meles meles]XP_045843481.1 uncharacterized protein C16orf95 homolog isoform X4 [Meles meles]XP_045843482.1 uncharacterized protein C16orf95 homolog isoform X4 [Meles meles]XP_045843483.1 uncharacterized protein C16orf95 homolog isoform X4 [Meles meles]